MLESTIQSNILKYLNGLDKGYFFKTIASNKAGVPDVVGVYKGISIWIEIKTYNGKLSKLQECTKKMIENCGGRYLLAKSLDEVKTFIGELV